MLLRRSLVRGLGVIFVLLVAVVPARAAVIDWVVVGDPGNAPDTTVMHQDGSSGYGSVSYAYRIGKYDVTNAQWVEFLNAKDPTGANTLGLYAGATTTDGNVAGITFNSAAPSGSKYSVMPGRGNRPVAYVTWFSALRFANWLNNGQGSGDTESGAYTLLGGTQTPSNANSISRNPAAKVFLPTENEWYKAAYYKGGGTNVGYWLYATQSDTPPTSMPPTGMASTANYNDKVTGYAVTGSTGYSPSTNYLTDVGAYGGSPSAYGAYDMSGDLFQWNEAVVAGVARGIRGGSWNLDDGALPSTNRDQLYQPQFANDFIGFRVAATLPEPVGMGVWTIAAILAGTRKARRTRSSQTKGAEPI
jgi:formylglycine-generating enzyme